MRIRCPHCRNAIEVVEDQELDQLSCPSCGSGFSLVVDASSTCDYETHRELGHFVLTEQLGAGAFGAVWKANDTKLDRIVAIKIPRKEQLTSSDSEMFLREARSAAQLKHPNIVGVHEVGRDGDTLFIVSDYIQGVSLADWLTKERQSIRESVELVSKISAALHVAHERGIVHRDLKPANIMLDLEGEPHIMDFGLAKRDATEITMTMEGQILGTPAYMSPEQAEGEGHNCDHHADIYSLGVILFELLTGERPFRGNSRMLLHQVIHDEAPSPRKLNNNIPRDVETICLKCLRKEPTKRYSSALKLSDDLNRFLNSQPVLARPVGRLDRLRRWAFRNPLVATLSTGLFLTITLALVITTSLWLSASAANRRAVIAGAIQLTDPDLVHARAIPGSIPGGDVKNFGWRVYIPPEGKYRLVCAVEFDSNETFPSTAGFHNQFELSPGYSGRESLITFLFHKSDGQWHWRMNGIKDPIPQHCSAVLNCDSIIEQIGDYTEVANDKSGKIVLLRWVAKNNVLDDDESDAKPVRNTKGAVTIWIEPVNDE